MFAVDRSGLEDLILYIIAKLSNSKIKIGRTRIIKLLYLIDLVALRRLNEKITGLKYYYHFYGPYAQEIIEVLDKLSHCGKVETTTIPAHNGMVAYDYRVQDLPKVSLEPEKRRLVDEIISKFGRMRLDKLLEVVYSTRPMQEKAPGDELL